MEPTNIQNPTPNKKKMIISIVILLIVLIGIVALLSSKSKNPVVDNNSTNTAITGEEDLLAEINSATTFDNEADMKEIDKEFQ